MSLIRLRLRRERIKVADQSIEQFASLLAAIGSPETVEGQSTYEQASALLLKPTWTRSRVSIPTLPNLKAALAHILSTPGALQRVAETTYLWRQITRRELSKDNFNSASVVEIMLQLSTPEPYIRHLNARGLPHLAAMFHPNTLERAKKDPALRGLFAGSNEYWDRTTDQLNIVNS